MKRVRKLFNGNVQVGDMTLGATSLDSSMQIGQRATGPKLTC